MKNKILMIEEKVLRINFEIYMIPMGKQIFYLILLDQQINKCPITYERECTFSM